MRRYLLLFVMSLACIIGMQAKITVVPPEESTSGAYELIFSDGDATATGEYANIEALPGYVKNATSLVFKTTEGYTLDDTEVAQITGTDNSTTVFSNLISLDLGDAELDHQSSLAGLKQAKTEKGLNNLKYFVFPKKITAIPEEVFSGNTTIEEVIMLESGDPNNTLTVIPYAAFKGCSNLSKVSIPNGVTTISNQAFGGEMVKIGETKVYTGPKMTSISFPNTLQKIDEDAFANCGSLKSVTIPESVTSIGKHAFQHNVSLTDVYVIGNNVKIGDQAFDHNLTQNEFEYHASEDGDANKVTIEDWRSKTGDNIGQVPLRLHIPNNIDALLHYMNPYLRFLNSLKDPALVKRALQELNNPQASNDQYVQQTIDYLYHWLEDKWYDNAQGHVEEAELAQNVFEKLQTICNVTVNDKGVYRSENWEEMDGWRYFHKGDGKFNFGEEAIYNLPEQDWGYFGWWNFMFVAGDIEEKTWPDGRMVDSRWYSAVFPFNLSYNQLMSAYGAKTDVREFTGVKSEADGSKTKLTVTFNQRVPEPSNHEDRYIEKGHPYMIHPGVRSYNSEGQSAPRYIAGISKKEAEEVIGNIAGIAAEETGKVTVGEYTFKGTYQDEYLPQYCYYLGMWPNDPESLKFYYTKTEGTTAKNWKQFTSIVMTSLGANGAKSMDMDFSIFNQNVFNDNYGIATSIEKAQTERELSDRIYNLNGQVVGNGSLQSMPKGIYVVNGKKIVVR